MSEVIIRTVQYRETVQGFIEWRKLLGAGLSEQRQSTTNINQVLHYAEQQGVTSIKDLNSQLFNSYILFLEHRPNMRRAGGVSLAYVNKQISTINKFCQYLWQVHHQHIHCRLDYRVKSPAKKHVLTQLQIAHLYDAAASTFEILRLRDRALLSLYYGCGLRRSEGVAVDIDDIDLDNRSLLIRQGKGYQQRYVPFTQKLADHFEEYLHYGRPELDRDKEPNAFLLSLRGTRLSGQGAYEVVSKLRTICGYEKLRDKKPGLHTLRHSIATHLLLSGLPINQIAEFLGHKSLESTQIYTHLAHEL
jgi:site-specific recombinase XerD